VVTSSTVEFSTGIYGLYGQLALTLIAAFLLLAGVANGFNAQDAMINVVRLLTRSRRLIPQTSVLGSSAIGLISGSGSASAAVVGTITIPLMIRYGLPRVVAAAVETSASMGSLIDPPMMGAAAFIMAEMLGVPYWDVVLRGFGFSFIYYISIGMAIYLFSVRLLPREPIDKPKVPLYQKVTTSIFFGAVAYLVVLMGFLGKGELIAAVKTASWMFVVLVAVFLYFKYVRKDPFLAGETLFASIRRGFETHAEMTSYLTELLATLGIMIGLFTITGFILRMGAMMLEVGTWNIVAMILLAWVFGWLLGTGLPPTATYIIGAVIIVPPMTKLGINPWVAHFFVFFLSVWGELSPPTSLAAAVCSRIANASFMGTMWEALKICLPITIVTFAIFTRSNVVVNPGWAQIGDILLITTGTCGFAFAMFGQCFRNLWGNILARILFAMVSSVTLFHPNDTLVWGTGAITLLALIWAIRRHNLIASPKVAPVPETEEGAPPRPEDLARVVGEARRDIG
jgi:TRAP transporter 4TM/12TM fusion protein